MVRNITTRLELLEARPRSGRSVLVAWLDDEPPSFTVDGEPVTREQWEAQRPMAAVVIEVRYQEHNASLL